MNSRATTDDTIIVQCPWCSEMMELWVERDDEGVMQHDCDVCCRPWQVHVQWAENDAPTVIIDRG